MEKGYDALLEHIKLVFPPKDLEEKICTIIRRQEKRAARLRLIFQVFLSASSLGGMAFIFRSLSQSFAQAGFGEYLSLLISDHTALVVYWKEVLLVLAESLPFLGLAAFLAVLCLFLWSLAKAIKDMRLALLTA